ncbi:MAG: 8-oxo-dGTP diphosphatase [Clostridia bacterium]|nr:8-oxo-dGTP diphosphatase [Clostridia bacterium]
MAGAEQVIFTNMCMIRDEQDRVVVQSRQGSWPGLAFPGGHVEAGESFLQSVIREVWEETGLTIDQPRLCGVKHWIRPDGIRYVVFLYRAERFSGELKGSAEGEVFWISRKELTGSRLARGFEETLEVFENDQLTEHYFVRQGDTYIGQLL